MQDRISTILRKTTKELCTYLEKVLPQADSNWWQTLVLEKLNTSQRLHVDQRKITELAGLDLAALLRIFNENWWLIAGEKKLAKEHRNYLKEMQTIRDKYAHPGTYELSKDDIYRHLDTILRFLNGIEASPELISELKTEKEAMHKVPPIPPVPEPDKEETIEVSKEADQPATPLTEKVNKLLEKFKDNIILLDAVYQWAAAPTSGIGRRHPPDHGLIKSNLQIRYGLDEKDAQNIYDRFRDEVVSAGIDDFDSGYLAVYETVIKYFSDENPVLKDAVLQRLKTASEQDKYIAWLYCKVKDDYRLWGREDGPTKEYLAVLKTTFGTMTNFGKVTQILTNLGFINRLEWVGAKHSQYNYKRNRLYCFPDYLRQVAETVDDIVPLPELPDYKRFVDALLEKKLVDALIAIERFLNNDSEYKKDLPTQPYITAEHDGVYAVNWRIRDDFKKYFFDVKGKEIQDIAEKIERILKDLNEKHYPSISLKEVGEAGLEGIPAWGLSIHDPLLSEKEIHIVLAPWFTLEQLKSFVDEASSKFVVTLTTMAGIPKLKTMYRDAFYKDINESGLNLAILDFTKGKVFEETIAKPPKLYEEIIEGLKKAGFVIERGKGATTEKPFVISAGEEQRQAGKKAARVEQESEPVIIPPTKIEPGKSIVLGDIVSTDELAVLMQQELNENERREKLSSKGPFYYPFAAASTHTAIFGITGGGKSVTTKRLVKEFVGNQIPVLILDWHDEYADLVHGLGGIVAVPPTAIEKPGKDEIPFTWNLLDPRFYSQNITPEVIEDYVGIVVDLLGHKDIMDLTEPMIGGLTEALKLAYAKSLTPAFTDISDLVEQLSLPPNTADALKRRIRKFSGGSLGSIFCRETSFNPQDVFTKPMCIRVKHLTKDHESAIGLLAFFVLRQSHGYFKRLGEVKSVRHITVIDEAPRVIGASPKVKQEVIGILQELRKFGEGLILVCRNPDISDDIMRETKQKIVHMLDLPEDVNKVSKMLGLKPAEKDLLNRLPPGLAFSRIEGNSALIRIKRT